MLKWAVNGSHRPNHLPTTVRLDSDNQIKELNSVGPEKLSTNTRRSLSNNSCQIKREKLRPKSSGHELTNLRRKIIICNKENNLTSTPLPLIKQIHNSPLRKLDSLKDLSNITPETPNHTPHNKNARKIIETNVGLTISGSGSGNSNLNLNQITNKKINNPLKYATTLPTFDVEYSPCGIIPGPLLALRGVGIADSYFEKPRYLPNDFPGYRKNDEMNPTITTTSSNVTYFLQNQKKSFHRTENDCKMVIDDESSLSSSKMGDTTLDKMIDAILESARKDRRIPKSSKQSQYQIMSPTYTPADDPASDLNEFWDDRTSKYRQSETKFRNNNNFTDTGGKFNEREVKTPDNFLINSSDIINNEPLSFQQTENNNNNNNSKNNNKNDVLCNLRRQRGVRRKRTLKKITTTNYIKSTVKQSAQKLFSGQNLLLRKSYDQLNEPSTMFVAKFSPDSGQNSASDLDDSNEVGNYTKRRLSFSPI